MIDALIRIYNKTNNKNLIKAAVVKGWITTEEYKMITGEDYVK